MLCDKCGKKTATTHYTQIINGEKRESHLCEDCAAESGYGQFFGDFPNLFGSMLFGAPAPRVGAQKTCPHCGATFTDITDAGQLGCADCYETFTEELLPTLARMHGKTAHAGKIPKSAGGAIRLKGELAEAKARLQKAIEAQAFEKAAELRDHIRDLEGKLGDKHDNQ